MICRLIFQLKNLFTWNINSPLYVLCFQRTRPNRFNMCSLKAFVLLSSRAKVQDGRANISTSLTFHLVTQQPPMAVSLRGNNNTRLLQYHYYHFGCMPTTHGITLHGRQIGNWNSSVMEGNCLSARPVCVLCKSRVRGGETGLINRISNINLELKGRGKL